jgi:Flp pilus assembly protein TadG
MARPFSRAQRYWARFRSDSRGNVSVMLGFCAIGLVGGVGAAIDTSVAYNVKSRLGAAVDSAALAGARAFASPNRDVDIEKFFNANFPNGYMGSALQPLEISADGENRTVTVTAKATIPTFFMRVLGRYSTDIAATAEATLSSRDIEVSLVLDVTGSMDKNNKMEDLKVAAKELVDIVVQDLQVPFFSKVALVPYSMGVNAGDLADQVRGPYIEDATCEYPDEPDCETFRFRNAEGNDWQEQDISTCVTERTGPHAYTDQTPNLAHVGRNFPRQDHNPCLEPEIVPLSSNKTALKDAINGLDPVGSTAGQIGIAWGWYMISPNFGYLFPGEGAGVPYGSVNLGQEVLKVVVIMTDGEFNTVYFDGVIARDSTSGSGDDKYMINQDATNGDGYHQSEQLCAAMKAEGIIVYTVGFDFSNVSNPEDVTDLMNNCATSPDHVYLPESGTALKEAFKDIAAQISNLRISM